MHVQDLQRRYSITRKPLYTRLNAINIKLDKDDTGRACATQEQIEQLDQLDRHLKAGGTLKNFVPVSSVVVETTQVNSPAVPLGGNPQDRTASQSPIHNSDPARRSSGGCAGGIPPSQLEDTQLRIVNSELRIDLVLPDRLEKALIAQSKPLDPLWYMAALERARMSEWLLTTSEVKQLIGVTPRINSGERSFTRGCFVFVKAGKIGAQIGWKVTKKVIGNG